MPGIFEVGVEPYAVIFDRQVQTGVFKSQVDLDVGAAGVFERILNCFQRDTVDGLFDFEGEDRKSTRLNSSH